MSTDVISKREFLTRLGGGFGLAALSSLMASDERSTHASNSLAARLPHFTPKARSVIQIFCPGGLSHVDTWDYKPELERLHGQPFDAELGKQTFAGIAGNYGKSMFPFRQHGECGRWISDLFPKLSQRVDDIAFIHSMQNKSALHGPAMFMMNGGFIRPGFPSMGAWVTYGLGSESNELPAFVVLPDVRGLPPGGVANWASGFLPAVHQGTVIETVPGRPAIADLFPRDAIAADAQRDGHAFLRQLNSIHANERSDSILEARIASYELAAKLQLSAPNVVNLAEESSVVRSLYELDDPDVGPFGTQCLLARRLVERGVRFVQIFCGAENTSSKKIRPNWDSHEDLLRDHGYWGRILDSGASALLLDLKSQGLLDSTLVICTTEFGRQPFMQGSQRGRDHNPGAFTSWLSGGGIKGGVVYGTSDERGWKAEDHAVFSYDLHATALHLLGLDHTKLTYYQNGIQRRLTDVHGEVIHELIG